MRKAVLPVLILLLTFTGFSLAQEREPGPDDDNLAVHIREMRAPQMMGVVHNRGGKPVKGVRVQIIRREDGHVMGDTRTDEQGRFAYPNLKNYRYNVKVFHGKVVELYHVRITPQNASPELVLRYK